VAKGEGLRVASVSGRDSPKTLKSHHSISHERKNDQVIENRGESRGRVKDHLQRRAVTAEGAKAQSISYKKKEKGKVSKGKSLAVIPDGDE